MIPSAKPKVVGNDSVPVQSLGSLPSVQPHALPRRGVALYAGALSKHGQRRRNTETFRNQLGAKSWNGLSKAEKKSYLDL